ncbi:ATP-binding protein [Oxalobacteraceae bacterium]|nr:ATP-binding protein [Oxalobacteraceae bacterium]
MEQKGINLGAASGENCTPQRGFPARLDAVPEALAFVAEGLRVGGLSESQLARAELILEELFRNTVLHGYGGDSAHSVWLAVAPGVFWLEDQAPPFNPLSDGPAGVAPQPGLAIELQPVGGAGLLLIRQLAQALRYEYTAGRNRVEVRLIAG